MWTDVEAVEVLARLRRQGNDDGGFEAKSCESSLGSSVWESVSAFANTSGGVLLLGVSEKDGFRPVVGFDANRTVAQFMQGMGDGGVQGARLTNPPEYEISRCEEGEMPFLMIDIRENPVGQKPCYVTAKGPCSGGYRRVDDRDVRLSAVEVYEFENAFTPSPADRQVVDEADVSDLDDKAVARLLDACKGSRALQNVTGSMEGLERLNVTDREGRVRLAGLLALGRYPQQFYPKLLVDVMAHPDVDGSDVDGPRFTDRVLCEGNMPDAVGQAVEAVARNLRTVTVVSGVGATRRSEIPREVLREVIANAVVHREYDARFQGRSVTVDVYPDRVEVASPGGLWGGVTLDTIGDGESRCRNATLMRLMYETPYTGSEAVTVEGGGTGIPLVIREMKRLGLPAPEFEARPDRFKVTLRRPGLAFTTATRDEVSPSMAHAVPGNVTGNARKVLDCLSAMEPRSAREIADMTGMGMQSVRKTLRTLIDSGLATPTAPASSRLRRYLLAGSNGETV